MGEIEYYQNAKQYIEADNLWQIKFHPLVISERKKCSWYQEINSFDMSIPAQISVNIVLTSKSTEFIYRLVKSEILEIFIQLNKNLLKIVK